MTAQVGDSSLSMSSSAGYTHDGNYMSSLTDSSGNTTKFNYDQSKGTLTNSTDANGKVTNYTYDNDDRLTNVSKAADGKNVSNSYTYSNDKISQIGHNGFNYNFGYDSLGNNTSVSAGSQNLITNSFEARTSKPLSSTYGNGQTVSSSYDNLDRQIAKNYKANSSAAQSTLATYDYDASGNLGNKNDIVNNISYKYIYDLADKLSRVEESNGNTFNYNYDINNNLSSIKDYISSSGTYTTNYSYDKDGKPVSTIYNRDVSGTYNSLQNSTAADFNFDNGDAADISGNGNNGIPHGNPTYGDNGHMGKELILNPQTKDWIESKDFSVPESFSVSMWIKPRNISDSQCIVGKHDSSGGNIFLIGMWGGNFEVDVRSGAYLYNMNGGKISPGTYQHIVATVNKVNTTQSSVTVYCNGISLGSQTVNGVMGNTAGRGWTIGQDWDGDSESDYYNGAIDEVKVFNKVLSSDEVNALHNDLANSISVINSYDKVGSVIYTGNAAYKVAYSYQNLSGTNTTKRVQSISNNGNVISYTYDANGNILTETQNNNTIRYTYNELNELVREDNQVLNKTTTYSYDAGGNITSRAEYPYTAGALGSASSVINYAYGDSNWKDKLTNYNGKDITYDAIGNPLSYDGWSFTWELGKQLSGMAKGNTSLNFKYDDSGVRTQKTVNGVTTTYRLNGDEVTFETDGKNKIYYTYDSAGNILSMNLNGAEYYYVKDNKGDIIQLIDKNGNIAASYLYDTWGKLISIKDSAGKDVTNDSGSVGYINPYRYRGYRYDNETGLYYLQSRYYNPEWGRFINGDSIAASTGELLTGNMFAYCKNNPVNMEDDDGTRPMPINGDQSPEITQVSCEIMNSWVQRTYHPSTYHPSRSRTHSSGASNFFSKCGSTILSGIDTGAGKFINETKVAVPQIYRSGIYMARSTMKIPTGEFLMAEGGAGKVLSIASKGGILGTLYSLVSAGTDVRQYGLDKRGLGRAGIDAGIGIGLFAAGVLGAPALPLLVAGIAAGALADYFKKKYL